MAGNWIKFEVDTPEKPEVLALTVAMGWDDPDLTVGKLLRVWRWFDQHTLEGNAPGVSAALLDRIAGVTGFSTEMAKVGWLIVSDDGISLPNFDRHNGETAKSRALTAKRVAKHKANSKGNDAGNADSVTSPLPKEDKNKEEVNNPPNPPSPTGDEGAETKAEKKPKRERKPRTALKTFLAACRANGVKPVTTYAPLMEYVEGVGLPADFLELAWDVFCHEHMDGGANAARLQADWQRHFANYVTKGYYRLWVCKPDGTFELTSTGQQARRFHKQEAA
ncbi:hypothetical protein R77592_04397 [Ralstonia mannitolilytica]|uniref:DnaT DNA-binding domain-containing protein n=1 Tax=Ralstonia pickettii (strain 12D) TaxID=428406 RepID=C6BBU7_RALP1|nr:hypothetical protein [Ralstonia mannitolilytica]CAJ0737663.1 hypothetical protein R77592_04397 [Ralstonia mannitolilytica]SUD94247.1 Uncharacterised protein [Ralstonia mannitolilytica]